MILVLRPYVDNNKTLVSHCSASSVTDHFLKSFGFWSCHIELLCIVPLSIHLIHILLVDACNVLIYSYF